MSEDWEFRVSRNVVGEVSDVVEALLTEALGPSRPGPPLPAGRRGLDTWEVLIVANASIFLASFLKRSGERAADGLFDLLKKFGERIPGDGKVLIEDGDETDRLELNVRTVTIEEIRETLAQRTDQEDLSPGGRIDT